MDNSDIEKPPAENKPSFDPKIGSHKRLLLLAALALAAIAAGLIFVTRQQLNKDKSNDPAAKQQKDVPLVAPTPEAPTDDYGKAIIEADQLYIKNDFDGAIKTINTALPKITDKAQLFNLYARLGRCYKAKGDLNNAIKSFEQAQQTGYPAADALYIDIAETAEKAGNKAKAIAAYKKAIEILDKTNSPAAKKIAESYQAKIKSLGG